LINIFINSLDKNIIMSESKTVKNKNRGTPATRPNPISHRYRKVNYESKWRERKNKRVEKPIPPNFYGYENITNQLKWSKVGFPKLKTVNSMGKDVTLTCWRHPVHKSQHWLESTPQDFIVYGFKSVNETVKMKPVPGYDLAPVYVEEVEE